MERIVSPMFLESVGKELYGEHWVGPAADMFGVSKRTVRRWAYGEAPAPQETALYLRIELTSKKIHIERLLADLVPLPTDGPNAKAAKVRTP
tara:strand:- start:38 stop:313 length:276 start_codon:yes stop_codon:yes gene_type:complete